MGAAPRGWAGRDEPGAPRRPRSRTGWSSASRVSKLKLGRPGLPLPSLPTRTWVSRFAVWRGTNLARPAGRRARRAVPNRNSISGRRTRRAGWSARPSPRSRRWASRRPVSTGSAAIAARPIAAMIRPAGRAVRRVRRRRRSRAASPAGARRALEEADFDYRGDLLRVHGLGLLATADP